MKKKTHRASISVTVVRDRKIRTSLITNQIVGLVTMPAWKKIIKNILLEITAPFPLFSHTGGWGLLPLRMVGQCICV